jgi:hypothetical protein
MEVGRKTPGYHEELIAVALRRRGVPFAVERMAWSVGAAPIIPPIRRLTDEPTEGWALH